jgi:hypothetical protein
MSELWRRLAAWRHAEDSLVAAANTVALVVAWNTPFYPLYVWWAAGSGGMPYALATLCSLPFFAAVPEVTRRSPRAGRAMLPVVGVVNSVFCTWLLGADSGTELFNLPCIVLGGLLFRPSERVWQLAIVGLPIAALLLFHGHYGTPPHVYTAEQYHGLFAMNLFSVATLFGFMALLFGPASPVTPAPIGELTARQSPHPNTRRSP